MSQLTLSWRWGDEKRSQTFDLASFVGHHPGKIRLGRDPDLCDVILSDPRVSRLHLEIFLEREKGQFQVRNLKQSNPVMIDGRQLGEEAVVLQENTILVFGDTQMQVYGLKITSDHPIPQKPPINATSSIRLSQILPLSSTGKDLRKQRFFIPGILTVIWVVLLFSSIGTGFFNLLLAGYLGIAGFYFIYQLCDKPKPWWVLAIPIIATPILLLTPVWSLLVVIFREILPGKIPEQSSSFIAAFIAFFFGAGLAEELLKALPILGLDWLSQQLRSPWKEKMGVAEPLDGIILGAASGLGFTILETLGQYVPDIINSVSMQADVGTGQLLGLQLLIPRIVGSVFGHMAYSGYFGYYIGLSKLKPKRRWQLLGVGYLLAAGVHALWNSSDALGNWALAASGILAYCLLMGAILKARELSPIRSSRIP